MIQPDSAPCPAPSTTALAEVRQIYRRLCLHRVGCHRGPDQNHVEQELADALAGLPETDALPEALQGIYAAEEERVANAYVLARLLAPLLAGQIALPVDTAAAPTRPRPRSEIIPLVRAPSRPTANPSVADFIDEMIAAEQPARSAR